MENRVKRCYEALQEYAPAAIIISPENRFYLTGIHTSAGMVILTGEENFFFTDFRYIEAAREKVKHMTVVMQDGERYPALAKKALLEGIRQGHFACGMEDRQMTVRQYRDFEAELGCELIGISSILAKQRSIKEPCEVDAIRRAQAITDQTFTHILDYIRPGRTERDIAIEMDFFMRRNGAEGPAFPTIAISGVKTSMPHGVPEEKEVRHGDFVTMDFGAMVDGYCSDMTRTVAVGAATDFMVQVYETVLQAQKLAFPSICAGKACCDVDKVARDYIEKCGFRGCFGHGLGHSLGLEIHEEPRFSPNCCDILSPGMVITVEPGIYLAGKLGVRIENMALCTADGCEDLTKSPRELMVL